MLRTNRSTTESYSPVQMSTIDNYIYGNPSSTTTSWVIPGEKRVRTYTDHTTLWWAAKNGMRNALYRRDRQTDPHKREAWQRIYDRFRHIWKTFDMGGAFQEQSMTVSGPVISNLHTWHPDNKPTSGSGTGVLGSTFLSETTAFSNTSYWPGTTSVRKLSEMSAYALSRSASAISAVIPNVNSVALLNALFELREGLNPFKDAGLNPGKWYLGTEFGLKPLISDIQGTLRNVANTRALLEEYARRYERFYKRHYTFPTETVNGYFAESSGLVRSSVVGRGPGDRRYGGFLPPHAISFTASTETRLAAEFIYRDQFHSDSFLEQLDEWAGQANYLLGLDPTRLAVIWNAIPWTWLTDWYVSIGDVMKNISFIGRDGLVMRYGYITVKQQRTLHVRPGPMLGTLNGPDLRLSFDQNYYRKVRLKASPYGFGLNPDAFTEKQWAILAALGIAKGGKNIL